MQNIVLLEVCHACFTHFKHSIISAVAESLRQ
jgi:hypothetical protein